MNKDITQNDFETCLEILKSFGIDVKSYDNVWSTMFFKTNEWTLSLRVLNDINEDLREKTNFYLFSISVPKKGSKTLNICIGTKEELKDKCGWEDFDDYMIYNETEKRVITWQIYGDKTKYFLSQEYYYENDMFEEISDKFTMINEEITKENTLESLIKRTKEMK